MAKSTNINAVQNVNNPDGVINNGTGTAKVTIWTAGANDSVLKALGCTSTDTNPATVLLYFNRGGAGTDRLIGAFALAPSSGSDGTTPAFDILRSTLITWFDFDAYGNHVLNAIAGSTLKAAVLSAVTMGAEIDFFGDGGDF